MVADVYREQLRLRSERRRQRRHEEGFREGRESGRQEGYEAGFREGYEKGRREERARWEAWLARMEAAERENRPFDEPPPGGLLVASRRVAPRQRPGIGDQPLACL